MRKDLSVSPNTCQGESGRLLRRGPPSGKLGPIEAECFADLANRTGVKIMALAN
jgi:hypothetical protein